MAWVIIVENIKRDLQRAKKLEYLTQFEWGQWRDVVFSQVGSLKQWQEYVDSLFGEVLISNTKVGIFVQVQAKLEKLEIKKNELLNELEKIDVCPTCGQKIPERFFS